MKVPSDETKLSTLRFGTHSVREGFYRLPVLHEQTFEPAPSRVQRFLPAEDYNTRSAIHVDPGHYTRFYLRSVMAGKKVHAALGEFLQGVAKRACTKIRSEHPTTPTAAVKYHVLHSMYHGAASVDAVFGDLFRLLYGDASSNALNTSSPVFEHLHKIVQDESFEQVLVPACKDNVLLSTLTALNILNDNSTQESFGESVAQDAQSDQDNDDDEGDGEDKNEEEDGEGESQSDDGQGEDESEGDSDSSDGDGQQGEDDEQEQQQDSSDAQAISDAKMKGMLQSALGNATQKLDQSSNAPDEAMDIAGDLAGDQFKETVNDISQISVVTSLLDNMLSGSKAVGPSIENIFDLVGRFRGVESEALTITSLGDGEMIDVTMGSDINRVLPSEYLALAMPETEMQFFSKLLEGGLLEAERHGYDEAGFGPVIVMMDVSGSMSGGFQYDGSYYTKQSMAAAFTLSMVRHCVDQKRDCLVIPFQSTADVHKHVIFSSYLRKSKVEVLLDIDKVCAMSGGGGTSFTSALEAIPDLLKSYPHILFEQADVIFFSDGYGDYPDVDAAKELRERTLPPGSRIFGLFITEPHSSTEEQREQELRHLEERNLNLFDACVATHPDGLRDGLKRLYKIVVEQGFYHIGEQQY